MEEAKFQKGIFLARTIDLSPHEWPTVQDIPLLCETIKELLQRNSNLNLVNMARKMDLESARRTMAQMKSLEGLSLDEPAHRLRVAEQKIAFLTEALQFYARHEHWMEVAEGADMSKLLVANSGTMKTGDGWEAAELALAQVASIK